MTRHALSVRRPAVAVALATLFAVSAGACAGAARSPRAARAGAPVDSTLIAEPAPVEIDNNYKSDVNIVLVRGGVRRRLGTVPPNTRRQLAVPAAYVNDEGGFALRAEPIAGGGGITSQTVVVRRGQRIVWTLESRLSRSVLAVQ